MLTRIDYIIRRQEAFIYRCYGIGSSFTLPETVDGYPVTTLTDHCFAAEPSYRYNPAEIKTWIPDSTYNEEGLPIHTLSLEDLTLPESVTEVGNYCFYGCLSLKKLSLYGSLKSFGGGVFTGCTHLKELTVHGFFPESLILKNILAEITYEIDVRLFPKEGEGFTLVYPDYYEESVENTPARIIDISFHGSGYRYRQGFKKGEPDLPFYDSLFYYSTVTESVSCCVRLAFFRLRYPKELSEEAKETYRSYLSEHASDLFPLIQERNEQKDLDCLKENGFFTESVSDLFSDLARRAENTRMLIFLNSIRRTSRASAHRTFEL